jgi:outer membrane protein OmpA-like peptidoglycan-associated protein
MRNQQKLNADGQAFAGSARYMGFGSVFAKKLTNLPADTPDKYLITNLDEAIHLNTINAREKELGKMFDRIALQMKTMNSPLKTQTINFSAMDIEFAPGESELDSQAQNYLKKYAENLQQTRSAGQIKLYIAAAAGDVNDIKQRYILSAQRAHQVEAFLKSSLPNGFNCPIYSVGTATNKDSAKTSQVLAAVLRNEKD